MFYDKLLHEVVEPLLIKTPPAICSSSLLMWLENDYNHDCELTELLLSHGLKSNKGINIGLIEVVLTHLPTFNPKLQELTIGLLLTYINESTLPDPIRNKILSKLFSKHLVHLVNDNTAMYLDLFLTQVEQHITNSTVDLLLVQETVNLQRSEIDVAERLLPSFLKLISHDDKEVRLLVQEFLERELLS